MLDWQGYYVENVNTWVYFQTASQTYKYAPLFRSTKIGTGVGIFGINYNETAEDTEDGPVRTTFSGYRLKPGGSYQAGGGSEGPTNTNGTNVYFSNIRNFQIRLHGSDDWAPSDPGPGQDGDTA